MNTAAAAPGTVFEKDGVTVTKVQAARLSKAKFTYTVAGHGTYDFGYLRKSDAVAAAKAILASR